MFWLVCVVWGKSEVFFKKTSYMNIQRASLVAQTVKNLPAMQETQV